MRTLLSITQNRALVKQKDRRTILSLFAEHKHKKNKKNIGELLLRSTIEYIKKSRSCQQKRSRNLDQFCVLLFLFSSDFSLDF